MEPTTFICNSGHTFAISTEKMMKLGKELQMKNMVEVKRFVLGTGHNLGVELTGMKRTKQQKISDPDMLFPVIESKPIVDWGYDAQLVKDAVAVLKLFNKTPIYMVHPKIVSPLIINYTPRKEELEQTKEAFYLFVAPRLCRDD